MHRAILLILVTMLLTQLPALADRDDKTFTKLMEIASGTAPKDTPGDLSSLRGGGTSGKPLGFYKDADVVFRSGYEKQPAKTMAEFASDLAQFISAKGGGYDNFVAYQKEQQQREQQKRDKIAQETGTSGITAQIASDLAGSLASKPDPYDPTERAHVSYSEQRKFAEKWWQSHNPAFASNLIQKDWWLNDAILDANNIWARCSQSINSSSSATEQANRLMWMDTELKLLVDKK